MLEKYLASRCEFGVAIKPRPPVYLIYLSLTEMMNIKEIISSFTLYTLARILVEILFLTWRSTTADVNIYHAIMNSDENYRTSQHVDQWYST